MRIILLLVSARNTPHSLYHLHRMIATLAIIIFISFLQFFVVPCAPIALLYVYTRTAYMYAHTLLHIICMDA